MELEWLRGLKEAVMEDEVAVAKEGSPTVDEERKKRGLTTWPSSVADYRSQRLAHQLLAELREEMDRELAKPLFEPEGEVESERCFLPLLLYPELAPSRVAIAPEIEVPTVDLLTR